MVIFLKLKKQQFHNQQQLDGAGMVLEHLALVSLVDLMAALQLILLP